MKALINITALQIGYKDWNESFKAPRGAKIYDESVIGTKLKISKYDVILLNRNISDAEYKYLFKKSIPYTVFVDSALEANPTTLKFLIGRCAKKIDRGNIQTFLDKDLKNYFSKPYGEKLALNQWTPSESFNGDVSCFGGCYLTISGDIGEDMHQVAYWRYNVPIQAGQALDLWLEYQKTPGIEIELEASIFEGGSISSLRKTIIFTEEDLKKPVNIDNDGGYAVIFYSINAKGSGSLDLIGLHERVSRRGVGEFLPGGVRRVSSDREEVFGYFNPQDMKPPLCVYFSGYKTLEGFEGINMMSNFGAPYLLIAEPRLEGGAFYLGSKEYEKLIEDLISECCQKLGFTNDQVILSGLSMGTFGAMYYSCDILPHAAIIGKPLVSLGDMAENERINRPGGFPTSLDLLLKNTFDTDKSNIEVLNKRFWDKFSKSDFSKTKFVIAYMIEDDYDTTAYSRILENLKSEGVCVYGKGLSGRHNDNTGGIVNWFVRQYAKVLREDFGREVK